MKTKSFQLAAAGALLLSSLSRAALAQCPSCLPGETAPTSNTVAVNAEARATTDWYGAPSVAIDVASVGLVTTGALTFSFQNQAPAALMLTGLAGYSFGAPIVHAANGEWTRAGVSLGLRAAPWVLWGALRAVNNNEDVGNWALAVGAVTAMIVDDALLAHHEPKKHEEASPSVTVYPTVDTKNRGASVQMSGSF